MVKSEISVEGTVLEDVVSDVRSRHTDVNITKLVIYHKFGYLTYIEVHTISGFMIDIESSGTVVLNPGPNARVKWWQRNNDRNLRRVLGKGMLCEVSFGS